MLEQVEILRKEIEALHPETAEAVEIYRIKYLSRKGIIPQLFDDLKVLPTEQKKMTGKPLNELKQMAEGKLKAWTESVASKSVQTEIDIDLTLPPVPNKLGSQHPLNLTRDRIIEIFERLGFNVADGAEIEDDWHNFSALNFPENHPAREMQDTFFISKNPDIMLRTHTSNVQIRLMESQKPPIRAIIPGRVYRNEAISARAHCFFHQVEGLYVDRNVGFADLKQTLYHFAKEMFGKDTKIR